MQDVEAQMRRALGLFGAPRRAEPERAPATPSPRTPDRFGTTGHKRRFVQDGEVPVTVLHGRRDHPPVEGANRLEAVEAALQSERAAREKTDRALAEATATSHDLRTKLGHASLAQQELQAAAERDQTRLATLQTELQALRERLTGAEQRLASAEEEAADEHDGRMTAERALRLAEAAREDAERLMRELDRDHPDLASLSPRRAGRPSRAAKTDAPLLEQLDDEPDGGVEEAGPAPVQWWLLPEKKARRR